MRWALASWPLHLCCDFSQVACACHSPSAWANSAAPAELQRAGPSALPVTLGSAHASSPVHLSSCRGTCSTLLTPG